jgi:hypothetical protein
LREYQPTEIAVAAEQDPLMFMGDAEQFGVVGPCQTEPGGRDNIVS